MFSRWICRGSFLSDPVLDGSVHPITHGLLFRSWAASQQPRSRAQLCRRVHAVMARVTRWVTRAEQTGTRLVCNKPCTKGARKLLAFLGKPTLFQTHSCDNNLFNPLEYQLVFQMIMGEGAIWEALKETKRHLNSRCFHFSLWFVRVACNEGFLPGDSHPAPLPHFTSKQSPRVCNSSSFLTKLWEGNANQSPQQYSCLPGGDRRHKWPPTVPRIPDTRATPGTEVAPVLISGHLGRPHGLADQDDAANVMCETPGPTPSGT